MDQYTRDRIRHLADQAVQRAIPLIITVERVKYEAEPLLRGATVLLSITGRRTYDVPSDQVVTHTATVQSLLTKRLNLHAKLCQRMTLAIEKVDQSHKDWDKELGQGYEAAIDRWAQDLSSSTE